MKISWGYITIIVMILAGTTAQILTEEPLVSIRLGDNPESDGIVIPDDIQAPNPLIIKMYDNRTIKLFINCEWRNITFNEYNEYATDLGTFKTCGEMLKR